MLKSVAAAAVLTLAAVAPGAVAHAQDVTGMALVNALLDQVATEFGLTSQGRVSGSLSQGSSQTVTINIGAGDVAFIGVCDENCSDVDLIVRDSSGREIGRDFEDDDVPMVIAQGAAAGRYTLEVQMPSCNGTCNWGVGAFK